MPCGAVTLPLPQAAGLTAIVLTPKPGYVDGMTDCNDPLYREIKKKLPAGEKLSDYVTSLNIDAHKPVRKLTACT